MICNRTILRLPFCGGSPPSHPEAHHKRHGADGERPFTRARLAHGRSVLDSIPGAGGRLRGAALTRRSRSPGLRQGPFGPYQRRSCLSSSHR